MSTGKAESFRDTDPIRVRVSVGATKVLSAPTRSGRMSGKPERVEEERRCHCGTKLNPYNPADECYLHAPAKRYRHRPKYRTGT